MPELRPAISSRWLPPLLLVAVIQPSWEHRDAETLTNSTGRIGSRLVQVLPRGPARLVYVDNGPVRKTRGQHAITPLGSVRPWPVIADERMRGREITLGAGEHGLALAVDADEILQALNASVADISDPEAAT